MISADSTLMDDDDLVDKMDESFVDENFVDESPVAPSILEHLLTIGAGAPDDKEKEQDGEGRGMCSSMQIIYCINMQHQTVMDNI